MQFLGRGEYRGWPTKWPVSSFGAFLIAFALGVGIFVYQEAVVWTPLQRWYWNQYLGSEVFPIRGNQPGNYHVLAKLDRHNHPLLATDADVVPGPVQGQQLIPFTLSAAARQAGAVELKLETVRFPSQQFHKTLSDWIYQNQSPDDLIRPAFFAGLGSFGLLLILAIPRDRARLHMLEHGRRLKGPQMITVKEFNRWSGANGIGFATTKKKETLSIPRSFESSHMMIMGDSGAGKSVLERQVLMQIAARRETAIVYDPALEYTPQFFNPARGDLILNPLDARCPYWSPSDEVLHEAEALTLATSLFPDKPHENTFFVEGPRKIFAHLLTLKPTPEQLVWWMSHEEELDRLLKGTELAAFIYRGAGPQRGGVLGALKLLQSEGVLTIASTGKESNTGRLITHQYRVEGPVMIFLTTTAVEMDEELLNRCIVLTVNEDPEQTKAIHQKQREAQTREGLWAREERQDILKLHRNAQRLLRPIRVANEHAPRLTFPYNRTRTRRDHMKFLTLINAITLLHQYQREVKSETRNSKTLEYIEATEADVEMARQLVNQTLPPSLDDLPPQTRHLLLLIDKLVSEECARQQIERCDYRFSRRTVRHFTQWGDSVLKKHLHRLEEMEYLIVHRGGRGQSFVYELDFETDEHGNPVVPGLGYSYDAKKSRANGELAPSSHAQVAGVARVVTMAETRMDAGENRDFRQNRENQGNTGQDRERPIVAKANGRAGVK